MIDFYMTYPVEKQIEILIKTELNHVEPATFEISGEAVIHLDTWSPRLYVFMCVYIYTHVWIYIYTHLYSCMYVCI